MPREPITLPLEEPVQAHGETITHLVLRSPSGADLLQSGWPFTVERSTRTGNNVELVHWPATRLLLSGMAQVPPSTIDALTPLDKMQAVEAVKLFFLYRTPPKPSPPPSAGDAGAAT